MNATRRMGWVMIAALLAACSGNDGAPPAGGSGGIVGQSGAANAGGVAATGGATSSGGGASASGGVGTGVAGASSGGSSPASGGAAGGGGTGGGAGGGGTPGPGACGITAERVRVTDVDVGVTVVSNEDEAALKPIMVSPVPSGGSRIAFMSNDDRVHVVTVDANDVKKGDAVSFPAHDFSDVYADEAGGVLLLTRDAQGGGTLNCGNPANLCGTPPSPPVACHDMYMVRFDGATERWATRLTNSSAELPPYSTGRTGPRVYMIWWYAHHGRIASDGSRYAGYFGSAISVSEGGCINIHQGDRMQVVDGNGAIVSGGFEWGCSHSGYERVTWDDGAKKFVTICKTDNQNRIAFAPNYRTILPVDLAYSNLSDLVTASGGGYWAAVSNIRAGQPAGGQGLADVHLVHFEAGAPDKDLVVEGDAARNHRAPHLAAYGPSRLLLAWGSSTRGGDLGRNDAARELHVQTRDRTTGAAEGAAIKVDIRGNRYQSFVAHPDGSVAFAAPGANATSVRILRVLPCSG